MSCCHPGRRQARSERGGAARGGRTQRPGHPRVGSALDRPGVGCSLAGRILKLCISLGDSITGEHGVGLEKLEYLPLMFSEDDLAMMHRRRREIDPAQLTNPRQEARGHRERENRRVISTVASVDEVQEAARRQRPSLRGNLGSPARVLGTTASEFSCGAYRCHRDGLGFSNDSL
jgi:hypothetical protein